MQKSHDNTISINSHMKFYRNSFFFFQLEILFIVYHDSSLPSVNPITYIIRFINLNVIHLVIWNLVYIVMKDLNKIFKRNAQKSFSKERLRRNERNIIFLFEMFPDYILFAIYYRRNSKEDNFL